MADINQDLIGFYRVLKREPKRLHDGLISMPRTVSAYGEARSAFACCDDEVQRAVLFWYLNRHCFNGLFRTNRKGLFNVPFGSKLPPLPAWSAVSQCATALRRASVKCSDFEQTLADAGEGSFVYVDPPYRRAASRDRGEYGIGAMRDDEMARLLEACQAAGERGARVLISYNADLSASLPGWHQEVINGRRLISADPDKRVIVSEYTVANYKIDRA